jgi:hypothetical protein
MLPVCCPRHLTRAVGPPVTSEKTDDLFDKFLERIGFTVVHGSHRVSDTDTYNELEADYLAHVFTSTGVPYLVPTVFGPAAFSRPEIHRARPLSPPVAGEVPRPSTGSHYALVEASRSMTDRQWATDFPQQIEKHLRIFLDRARDIPGHAFETIRDLFAVVVLASPFGSSGSPVADLLADTSLPLLRML